MITCRPEHALQISGLTSWVSSVVPAGLVLLGTYTQHSVLG